MTVNQAVWTYGLGCFITKTQYEGFLKHPLGPIPWSLANTDGTPKKTNKAALARKLESKASPDDIMETPSICIIDGMSIVQNMKGYNFDI